MQHGTGREYVTDIVENVLAVLEHEQRYGRPYGDLVANLRVALGALTDPDLDIRGAYGPDYGAEGPFKGHFPVGSIRDTRPEGLGR